VCRPGPDELRVVGTTADKFKGSPRTYPHGWRRFSWRPSTSSSYLTDSRCSSPMSGSTTGADVTDVRQCVLHGITRSRVLRGDLRRRHHRIRHSGRLSSSSSSAIIRHRGTGNGPDGGATNWLAGLPRFRLLDLLLGLGRIIVGCRGSISALISASYFA
jgi:hypothetical protein